MVKEQKPFLVRAYDQGQDILITFDFHNRSEVVVTIDDSENSRVLNDAVDYDIIYKFNRGYVTLHLSNEIEVTDSSSIIVSRSLPQEQACSMTSGRKAPRPNLEVQLDRTVMMVQDMDFENRNALKLPLGDPAEPVLPLEADRAESMFYFEDVANGPISYAPYPASEVAASPYMKNLLTTTTLPDYRAALQLWDISYKSIANMQRVLDVVPGLDTLPIFTPFVAP
jgi:hypothetical protein